MKSEEFRRNFSASPRHGVKEPLMTGRMGDENGRAQWAIKAVEVPVSIGLSSAAAP